MNLGKSEQTVDWCLRAIEHAEEINDQALKLDWLISLGNLYLEIDQSEKAIPYFEDAEALATTLEAKSGLISVQKGLSAALAETGELERSIQVAKLAIKKAQEAQDSNNQAELLVLMGYSQIDLGLTKEARKSLEKASQLYDELFLPFMVEKIAEILATLD